MTCLQNLYILRLNIGRNIKRQLFFSPFLHNFINLPNSFARDCQSRDSSPLFSNLAAPLTQLGSVGQCFSILPHVSLSDIGGKTGPVKPTMKG